MPILTVEMDATGTVSLRGVTGTEACGRAAVIDDVALILHTSGSTGRPKRVPLSHANLSISARNVARSYALTAERRVALRDAAVPRARARRLDAGDAGHRRHRRRAGKFSPLSFWQIARDHGATWYSAVPTIHQLLLARVKQDAPRPAGAEKLRFIRSCSASLPPQVMHDLEAAFGAPVLEAYGMTEAAHQMASNPLPPAARMPGSVGPGTDVEISIMDADGQRICQPGERGEVVHQGPQRRHAATRTTPRPTPRRSSTAGSAPATRDSSTSTAT